MSIASEIEELLRDIERWPIGGGTTDHAVILLLRAELERQTLAQRQAEAQAEMIRAGLRANADDREVRVQPWMKVSDPR